MTYGTELSKQLEESRPQRRQRARARVVGYLDGMRHAYDSRPYAGSTLFDAYQQGQMDAQRALAVFALPHHDDRSAGRVERRRYSRRRVDRYAREIEVAFDDVMRDMPEVGEDDAWHDVAASIIGWIEGWENEEVVRELKRRFDVTTHPGDPDPLFD